MKTFTKLFVVGVMVLAGFSHGVMVHAQSNSGTSDVSSDAAANSQDAETGETYVERAKVTAITSQEIKNIPGTTQTHSYQTLTAYVITGHDKGKTITVDNDYLNLKKGEEFYMTHDVDPVDGVDVYNVTDPFRLPAVAFWVGLFVVLAIIFGGKQGIRGLLSLVIKHRGDCVYSFAGNSARILADTSFNGCVVDHRAGKFVCDAWV